MIFLLNCQKYPALFYAKNRTNLSRKFHSDYLLELFEMASFFKKSFQYLENRSVYFYISKSSEFVVV